MGERRVGGFLGGVWEGEEGKGEYGVLGGCLGVEKKGEGEGERFA